MSFTNFFSGNPHNLFGFIDDLINEDICMNNTTMTCKSEYKNDNDNNMNLDIIYDYTTQPVSILQTDFTKIKINDISVCGAISPLSRIPLNTKSKKYIIAIDNDECIGSWSDLSLLYNMLKKEFGKEPDVEMFVDIMVKTACVRPYVKNFFEKLIELKKKGLVYKIFMFTAASNSTGWVVFLSKILERWIGQSLYDGIIFQEMIKYWHILNKSTISNNIGYIKNMNMIRELIDTYDTDSKNVHIVAIDDRPGNIINGIAIGVSAFRVAINLFEVLKIFLPNKVDYLMSKYYKNINEIWENYLKNPFIFTNVNLDIDILLSIEHIEKLIFV